MCGISCYITKGDQAAAKALDGLALLEHRGYDSVGIAFLRDSGVEIYKLSQEEKKDFRVADLREQMENQATDSSVAIGHNRWATFGGVNLANAHPHSDREEKFYLVQNGNVENMADLEKELGSINRYSETDTELIVNLIAKYYKEDNDFAKSVKRAINFIEGANAIVVMKVDDPSKLIAANKGGSLILAKDKDGVLLASDPSVLENVEVLKQKVLASNELAVITSDAWQIENCCLSEKNNEKKQKEKKDYKYFMEKEIFEQAESFQNTLRGRLVFEQGISHLDCTRDLARELRRVKTFHFVGCGTAYNACQYASLLLNRFGIASRAWIASEFCAAHPVYDSSDAFVFVSQSGETADTIEVVKEIGLKGNTRLGIVNVPGSKIWRDTEAGIGIRAGKERGVASTKAYTSQLASIVVLAVFLARQRSMTADTGQKILSELEKIPSKIQEILYQSGRIRDLAKKYKDFNNYYFLGRYFSSITAAEGSLKLKEISYVHAESYPLGEMKHGPLALVDEDFCSVVIAPKDSVFKKSLVNIQEIKARKGRVLAIGNTSSDIEIADDNIFIPETLDYLSPILSIIPLQLFSYYMALEFGKNPDKPRNLAKTVTVS